MKTFTNIIAAGGMKDWTVKEWAAFFAILGGFLTLTVGPFIVKTVSDIRALRSQNVGQQKQIDQVKSDVKSNTDNIVSVAIAKGQEPPAPQPKP